MWYLFTSFVSVLEIFTYALNKQFQTCSFVFILVLDSIFLFYLNNYSYVILMCLLCFNFRKFHICFIQAASNLNTSLHSGAWFILFCFLNTCSLCVTSFGSVFKIHNCLIQAASNLQTCSFVISFMYASNRLQPWALQKMLQTCSLACKKLCASCVTSFVSVLQSFISALQNMFQTYRFVIILYLEYFCYGWVELISLQIL